MNAMDQSTLFEAPGITVTDESVFTLSKTYPLSDIRSAEKIRRVHPLKYAAFFVLLVGAVMLYHPVKYMLMTPADPVFWIEMIPGLLFCAVGIWAFLAAKPIFSVRMRTASGGAVNLKARSEGMADHTVEAITAAVALAKTGMGN